MDSAAESEGASPTDAEPPSPSQTGASAPRSAKERTVSECSETEDPMAAIKAGLEEIDSSAADAYVDYAAVAQPPKLAVIAEHEVLQTGPDAPEAIADVAAAATAAITHSSSGGALCHGDDIHDLSTDLDILAELANDASAAVGHPTDGVKPCFFLGQRQPSLGDLHDSGEIPTSRRSYSVYSAFSRQDSHGRAVYERPGAAGEFYAHRPPGADGPPLVPSLSVAARTAATHRALVKTIHLQLSARVLQRRGDRGTTGEGSRSQADLSPAESLQSVEFGPHRPRNSSGGSSPPVSRRWHGTGTHPYPVAGSEQSSHGRTRWRSSGGARSQRRSMASSRHSVDSDASSLAQRRGLSITEHLRRGGVRQALREDDPSHRPVHRPIAAANFTFKKNTSSVSLRRVEQGYPSPCGECPQCRHYLNVNQMPPTVTQNGCLCRICILIADAAADGPTSLLEIQSATRKHPAKPAAQGQVPHLRQVSQVSNVSAGRHTGRRRLLQSGHGHSHVGHGRHHHFGVAEPLVAEGDAVAVAVPIAADEKKLMEDNGVPVVKSSAKLQELQRVPSQIGYLCAQCSQAQLADHTHHHHHSHQHAQQPQAQKPRLKQQHLDADVRQRHLQHAMDFSRKSALPPRPLCAMRMVSVPAGVTGMHMSSALPANHPLQPDVVVQGDKRHSRQQSHDLSVDTSASSIMPPLQQLEHWIDICRKRFRKREPVCELCHYKYQMRKLFKNNLLAWNMPSMSKRDKVLHTLFFGSLAVMLCAAVATLVAFQHETEGDFNADRSMKVELKPAELATIVAGLAFFGAFFVALYAEMQAQASVVRVAGQMWRINHDVVIEDYDPAKDAKYWQRIRARLAAVLEKRGNLLHAEIGHGQLSTGMSSSRPSSTGDAQLDLEKATAAFATGPGLFPVESTISVDERCSPSVRHMRASSVSLDSFGRIDVGTEPKNPQREPLLKLTAAEQVS